MTAMAAANPVPDAESKPSEAAGRPSRLPTRHLPGTSPAARTARDRSRRSWRPERFSRYAHGMRRETARQEAES